MSDKFLIRPVCTTVTLCIFDGGVLLNYDKGLVENNQYHWYTGLLEYNITWMERRYVALNQTSSIIERSNGSFGTLIVNPVVCAYFVSS